MSLFYRAKVTEDSEFVVMAMNKGYAVIPPNQMQFGYNLYGPGYELAATAPTGCVQEDD